jgi:hypothetical protein
MERVTLMVTEEVPLVMVTEPLLVPVFRSPLPGSAETAMTTATPPAAIVGLLAQAESQEKAGVVDTTSAPRTGASRTHSGRIAGYRGIGTGETGKRNAARRYAERDCGAKEPGKHELAEDKPDPKVAAHL